MAVRTVLFTLCSMVFVVVTASAEQSAAPIVFPKDKSIVGSRVNLVLDPTEIPFFQVIVGDTEYPIIDTSKGTHAFQGVELEPGLNTITVKVFTLSEPEENEKDKSKNNNEVKEENKSDAGKQKLVLLSTWQRQVFSMQGVSTVGTAPAGFNKDSFHSRDRETGCSGCHDLDAPPRDAPLPKKPGDMICSACHWKIPTGKHIHGPAAVWNCLACHNPDVYPVKYQFAVVDPWTFSKSFQKIIPQMYTIPTSSLFKPDSAAFMDKKKATEAMKEVIDYLIHAPGELMRIEVHMDKKPLAKQKGKKAAYKSNQALTAARALTLASLFKEQGIPLKRFTAVGMGDRLAKSYDISPEGRELNNRIEIVAYPADVKVVDSQKLPVLTDRKRVLMNLQYAQGPVVTKLRVIEKLTKDIQYVAGSSYYRGKALAPVINGNEVRWELGNMNADTAETLVFVLKNTSNNAKEVSISDTISLSYKSDGRERSLVFDPKIPVVRSVTIREACLKCHPNVMIGSFKHGPAVAGHCTSCHDPHASENIAWLRKRPWDLCVTCHAEKATGLHVLVSFNNKKKKGEKGDGHPTKFKRNPARRGERLSCVSCHEPHSAESSALLAYGVKQASELCHFCHWRENKIIRSFAGQ